MPDLPISQLPEKVEAAPTDKLVLVDESVDPAVTKHTDVQSVIDLAVEQSIGLIIALG